MKKCSSCGEHKTLAEFGISRSSKDGLQHRCKRCACEANRRYRERYPGRVRDAARESARRIREAMTQEQIAASKAADARYYRSHRDERLRWQKEYAKRKKVHGLTVAERVKLEAEQEYRCLICGKAPDPVNGRRVRLTVDHDHGCCPYTSRSCGKCIRGLICLRCNAGLGSFCDDLDILRSAVSYLEAWRKSGSLLPVLQSTEDDSCSVSEFPS